VNGLEAMKPESALVHIIRRQIDRSETKAISFQEYMELCLYAPALGYYTSTRSKVGKEGDFYTSSAVGGMLGEMLASFIVKRMSETSADAYEVIEWGGGTGQLAKQILDKLQAAFPEFYKKLRYIVIERSEHHRSLQLEMLNAHQAIVRFWPQEQWKEQGMRRHCFIFSNELLDALPVHRIRQKAGRLYELYVGWDQALNSFYEREIICASDEVLQYLEQENITLLEGQTAEINLAASHWIRELANWLEQGDIVTIDYGDVAEEIYGPHRKNGTLLCYKNHQAYDNPYIHSGEQDITAHVNFSACIRVGIEAGIEEWKLLTQKDFLVEAGILDQLQNDFSGDPFGPAARRNRAIRQLLLSDQMSELFKVLIQTKKGDCSG
jgi:SAM-dependent MidA family methyltransferase